MTTDQLKSRGYVEVNPGEWVKPAFLPDVVGEPESVKGPIGREESIHDQIEADLINRRFYYVHSRMDKRTTTALGVPDFIVAAPNCVTLWIEVKRRGGKLSKEQQITKHILLALNHHYFLVFSFDEYLAAINQTIK